MKRNRHEDAQQTQRIRRRALSSDQMMAWCLSLLVLLIPAGGCQQETPPHLGESRPPSTSKTPRSREQAPDSEREWPSGSDESTATEDVIAACEMLAVKLRDAGLEPEQSTGSVLDPLSRKELAGCSVIARIPTRSLAGTDPARAIRAQLSANGWREDFRHAADGPGTSAYAYRHKGVLCVFQSGAPSSLEDGVISVAARYQFEAGCLPDR